MRNVVKILLFVGTALLLVSIGYLSKAQRASLSKEAQAALQHFLDVDCEVNEQGESLRQLLAFKDVLEPILITILKEGPAKQALDDVQRSLDEQWARREAYLSKNSDLGLKEDELRIARGLTKEAYANQGREQFVRRYREKSAIGLAAIGSPEGIKTLREVSEKADEGLRTVIQSALARFQRK